MGADYFETYALGRDAADAFRSAREEAFYDHGHSGYTGTIAEKSDFFLAQIPKGTSWKRLRKQITLAHYARDDSDKETRDAMAWLVKLFGERTAAIVMETYESKWGPALAFELRGPDRAAVLRDRLPVCYVNGKMVRQTRTTKKAYVFCGYASS